MARKPSKGTLVYPYGMRRDPISGEQRMHNGEDLAHDKGVILVAPERAQLVSYRDEGGWGRLAVLRTGKRDHRLAHTSQLVAGVDVGEWFDEGDPVAIMGETGRAMGVHVHWEVTENGTYIDPSAWLARAAATEATTTKGEEMLVYIKGRAGHRKGGLYLLRGTGAKFLGAGDGIPAGVPVITDETQIGQLAKLYTGDL